MSVVQNLHLHKAFSWEVYSTGDGAGVKNNASGSLPPVFSVGVV